MFCTYAKQRGVWRSHFGLRTNLILAFFCMCLCCGWVHWHLLCWGWGETSGCPTLWGCSMVCIGKNITNCSKNPRFLPVMCALCPRCARAVHTRPHNEGHLVWLLLLSLGLLSSASMFSSDFT